VEGSRPSHGLSDVSGRIENRDEREKRGGGLQGGGGEKKKTGLWQRSFKRKKVKKGRPKGRERACRKVDPKRKIFSRNQGTKREAENRVVWKV